MSFCTLSFTTQKPGLLIHIGHRCIFSRLLLGHMYSRDMVFSFTFWRVYVIAPCVLCNVCILCYYYFCIGLIWFFFFVPFLGFGPSVRAFCQSDVESIVFVLYTVGISCSGVYRPYTSILRTQYIIYRWVVPWQTSLNDDSLYIMLRYTT